jgi:hypothetical protein
MYDEVYLKSLATALREFHDFERLDSGLTDSEVKAIQNRFGFTFPPDLRVVLQFAVPIGKRFPNWRDESETALRSRLTWPLEGIWFDVESNGFWPADWGEKPSEEQVRLEKLKAIVEDAPRLIPIYSHRYISAEPADAGNPIYSVHQSDIILYGNDLASYFHNEFRVPLPDWAATSTRPIRFWDDSLRWWD